MFGKQKITIYVCVCVKTRFHVRPTRHQVGNVWF